MVEGWIANRTVETFGTFETPGLAPYPDFFAASLVLLVCVVVAFGAKLSSIFNSIFAVIKLLVIAFIVGYGLSFADWQNWTDPNNGGFLPFGFSGVMAAASTTVFAYGGFDHACAAGEEAKNPKRDIGLSIILAFSISAVAYILMCSTLTLMLPYNQVAPASSFADAFAVRGAPWAKYVVAIGTLSALTTVLFASFFPVPRYIYAMASDGLIFRWLSVVNQRTQVPIRAITLQCVLTIIILLLLDLDALIEFLSMSGLLSQILISASVIIIRYRPRETEMPNRAAASAILAYAPWKDPTQPVFCILMTILAFLILIVVGLQILMRAFVQNEDKELRFRVPLVPFLPSVCMFINIVMILFLKPMTWLRYFLYLLVGATVYAVYGIRHSIHRNQTHPIPQVPSKRDSVEGKCTKF